VRRLVAAGVSIGSHSDTHAVMARLSPAALDRELQGSRDAIADAIGRPPRTFAYPFGTYGTFDARTRDALMRAGYDVACTTVWGRNGADADPLALRRLRVSWCDSPREIRKSLAGCYEWYRVVQRLQA
jgi:peptidoglycan/xylan/chitin deacetylase (PgdA/CDA1 family)